MTKSVSIFQNGTALKSFQCDRAEITGRTIQFFNVPDKSGGTCQLFYNCENLFSEVDFFNRVAIVRPSEPENIEIIVTW